MNINRELNVVIPLERDDNTTLYIHMTPLRYEVFERYYLVMAKTFNNLYKEGLREMGARVAYLMLKQVAEESGQWADVENGLISEFMRTSNALVLHDSGWQLMPMDSAVKAKLISDEEIRDFKGYAVFFSCIWSMHTPIMRVASLEIMANLWMLLTTSLDATAYKASLQTLTKADNTGESTAQLETSLLPS